MKSIILNESFLIEAISDALEPFDADVLSNKIVGLLEEKLCPEMIGLLKKELKDAIPDYIEELQLSEAGIMFDTILNQALKNGVVTEML